jgi:hypothetical protein
MGISLFVFALVLFFALDGVLISASYLLKKSLATFHGSSALTKRAPAKPAA